MTWSEEWRRIIFSDEKKFNLDGPDGFTYYFHDLRKEEKILSRRQQGVGSVMVWASFGWNRKSDLVFITGRIDFTKYQKVLEDNLLHFGSFMAGENWIFQQDNASIHALKSTMAWFEKISTY